MRSKLLAALAIVLVTIIALSLYSTSVQAQPRPGNAPLLVAQATQAANVPQLKCDDPDFLKGLASDLTDFGAMLKAFDATNAAGVAQTIIKTAALRQKYEDMSNVPANCATSQLIMIVAIANYSDGLSLVLAAKADPDNAKTYTDAVSGQMTRANTYLTALLGELPK
jgi:hypothetical protein